MKVWRSALLGVLGLAALQAAVGSAQGPGRVSGLLADLGRLAEKFLDPSVPAFSGKTSTTTKAQKIAAAKTSSSSSTTAAPTAQAPAATAYPATDVERLAQLLAGATQGSAAQARIAAQIDQQTPAAPAQPKRSATRIASET